jgi:hypothetical protein
MRGTVKDGFRQPGFGLMLFLWLTMIAINGYSAEAAVNASASVASPVSVDDTVVNFWGAGFVSEAIVGRLIIRIPGAGLPAETGGDADTTGYLALITDSRFTRFAMADFIKLTGGNGMLRGEPVSTLTVSAAGVTGFVTVTVVYN